MMRRELLRTSRAAGILLALSAAANAQFMGAPGSPYPAGASPNFVAVGDFNGDGKPDLAIANMGSNNVTVLLGSATGEFFAAPGSPVAVGSEPYSLAVADINRDTHLDLVVANKGDGTVSVLLGNGKGGFTADSGSPFAAGSKPYSVTVADFNADGNPDLAVANYGDSTVTVLLGNGGGGFTAAQGSPFAVGPVGAFPASMVVADFNGDGKPDLAMANFGDSTVAVLIGNGSGGFTPATGSPFAVGNEPNSVAVGDFNGDAKMDLVVVNGGANTVSVLLGNGTGGFTPGPGPYTVGQGPQSVVVADFNGDGKSDLAIANFIDSTVTILLGNGTGGFTPAQGSPFQVGTQTEPTSVATGDFNGDGKPDLAFAGAFADNVSVLLDSFTSVPPAAPVTVSAASGTAPVAAGSIVSIYGNNLATVGTPATTLPLPTSLGGTKVTITDSSGTPIPMPLFYAGPTQINAEIPQTASAGAATLTITTTANGSQTGSVMVAEIAPGLFTANQTGKGVPAAQFVTNQANGIQTTVDVFQCSGGAGTCAAVPLDVSGGNTALVLYGTGIQNRAALSDVTVTIGSQTLPVFYAGAAPNYAGEDQVDVLLPSSLAGSGMANVSVSVAGTVSNVVTVDIE